jgi:uncharacterized protein YheU (UPF0270 family)
LLVNHQKPTPAGVGFFLFAGGVRQIIMIRWKQIRSQRCMSSPAPTGQERRQTAWEPVMSQFTTQELTDLAEAAFLEVAKDVVNRAIETNTPVIVWKDGEIVNLDPRTMLPMKECDPNQNAEDSTG